MASCHGPRLCTNRLSSFQIFARAEGVFGVASVTGGLGVVLSILRVLSSPSFYSRHPFCLQLRATHGPNTICRIKAAHASGPPQPPNGLVTMQNVLRFQLRVTTSFVLIRNINSCSQDRYIRLRDFFFFVFYRSKK